MKKIDFGAAKRPVAVKPAGDEAVDNWVANHVADAARDNAAREHQEAVAAGVGPQVSDAAARRVHAVRRWLRSQGHQLADDVVEGG